MSHRPEEDVEQDVVDWEVEVAASSQTEELDPRTLGVPGLKTLMPGHCVEVLWAHGAYHSSLYFLLNTDLKFLLL